jgi:pimeloyl-ACP methyl ester carboxylesterase
MAKKRSPMLGGYPLTATADLPDTRDWTYQPALVQLKTSISKPRGPIILDQGAEGACTGFGLGAVINLLNQRRNSRTRVSVRMLYEMARKHDEWPGEDYPGSSCRGAIKGFANMGVCRESFWPYNPDKPGELSVKAAKDARNNTIGAYYRLLHRVSDFHAALNEAGVIYCSANVHSGWQSSAIKNGVIPFRKTTEGGHAFAIVGYTKEGFWVQNSWGPKWGSRGLALWKYEDWQENLVDAWVLRLALPTPQIAHLREPDGGAAGAAVGAGGSPKRAEIAGHFVHMDDGKFHDAGRYWSRLSDVKATASNLATNKSKYDHLLIYAHGGLNSPKDSAKRIAGFRDVFKDNRVYPFHCMYDTGVLEELKDVIRTRGERVGVRAGGVTDWWDRLLERLTRTAGRALWREMKFGARSGFEPGGAGAETLKAFAAALSKGNQLNLKIHLVGHSTGAILIAHLLQALAISKPKLRVDSVTLYAPAATVDLFRSHYLPLLKAPKSQFGIDRMTIYNLNEKLELDDTVGPYRKSLLYLVSRSFEEETPQGILGMQKYSKKLESEAIPNLSFIYSHANPTVEGRTLSRTHGGFDNDPASMNAMLKSVLGKAPKRPFKEQDLDY